MVGEKEDPEEEHPREATGICPGGWLSQRRRRQLRARQHDTAATSPGTGMGGGSEAPPGSDPKHQLPDSYLLLLWGGQLGPS